MAPQLGRRTHARLPQHIKVHEYQASGGGTLKFRGGAWLGKSPARSNVLWEAAEAPHLPWRIRVGLVPCACWGRPHVSGPASLTKVVKYAPGCPARHWFA